MSKAVFVHKHGGPDVLSYEDTSVGAPGNGEIRLRHTAVGLNFLDCYYRSGLYPAPNGLPLVPGNEACGIVEAVGPGVTSLKEGDRVAYGSTPIGAYATERVVKADHVVKVPDGISDEQAAGMMLKGMTAEYLLRRTFPVKAGDTILFHAAAGGVGLIAGQWAKKLGATVIGTAGGAEKVALAKANGYDHVIDYRAGDFAPQVLEITGGKKCDVVYDSIGADTFPASLDCLKVRGTFVTFGNASGPIPPFAPGILSQKGSLFMTRPTLFAYVGTRAELEESSTALFDVVTSGAVQVEVNQRYALTDVRKAHEDLEARRTTGTTVLLP